ncbi:universal stress protein [Bacillus sp. 1P06AnD]|uniref:universal stress protein n=1 Tax=Bacillus sp. 1P06AnD TaxID=3132208 RepID=UPI00399F24D4
MFKKILVAIDGSPMSDKALEAAFSFAENQGSNLLLLHVGRSVIMPPSMMVPTSENVYEAIKNAGEEIVRQAKEKAEAKGLHPEAEYVEGDPAEQIVDIAKDKEADLVIIGSRGLGNFKEFMLGGVSHKVSQHVHCPILIIK